MVPARYILSAHDSPRYVDIAEAERGHDSDPYLVWSSAGPSTAGDPTEAPLPLIAATPFLYFLRSPVRNARYNHDYFICLAPTLIFGDSNES